MSKSKRKDAVQKKRPLKKSKGWVGGLSFEDIISKQMEEMRLLASDEINKQLFGIWTMNTREKIAHLMRRKFYGL